MIKSYIIKENRFGYEKGTRVYKCMRHDYGLASDDTRSTGIEHVSVTLDENGDYPSFTIPVGLLEDYVVH